MVKRESFFHREMFSDLVSRVNWIDCGGFKRGCSFDCVDEDVKFALFVGWKRHGRWSPMFRNMIIGRARDVRRRCERLGDVIAGLEIDKCFIGKRVFSCMFAWRRHVLNHSLWSDEKVCFRCLSDIVWVGVPEEEILLRNAVMMDMVIPYDGLYCCSSYTEEVEDIIFAFRMFKRICWGFSIDTDSIGSS